MTRSEWERGVLKIPRTHFSPLRKSLTTAYNQQLETVMSNIKKFWKAHRHRDADALLAVSQSWAERMRITVGSTPPSPLNASASRDFERIWQYTISLWITGTYHTPKPTKVLLESQGYRHAKTTTRVFPFGFQWSSGVTLIPETSTLVWEVEEGDRACEKAHESFIGSSVLSYIQSIRPWQPRTGGVIVGSDEHRAQIRPYLKMAFGPTGKTEAEAHYFSYR